MTANHKEYFQGALALLVLGLLAYLPALRGAFIWDDDVYVSANQLLHSLDGLRRIWFDIGSFRQYYPLSLTAFWLLFKVFGQDPFGYHLVNVLGHACVGVLLWRLLRFLGLYWAWFAAAVYVVHPAMLEAVAWITELTAVLSGFFYLAAMFVCAAAFRLGIRSAAGARPSGWPRPLLLLAGLGLFLCALLAKTSVSTFPAALALLIWWRRGTIQRQEWLTLLPFFVLSIAMGLLAMSLERALGAKGAEFSLSAAERLLIAGRAWWFYIGKLLWPRGILFSYAKWEIDVSSILAWIYPFAVLALVSALWGLRRRMGRGPLAALLFYSGTVLPFLGFINVYYMRYAYVAQHFQYLAGIGIIVLTVSALATLAQRVPRLPLPVLRLAALLTLGLLASVTFDRTLPYRNNATLYTDILASNPRSGIALNNYAILLSELGRNEEAVDYYLRLLRIAPQNSQAMTDLGRALGLLGRHEEAIAWLRKALELAPNESRTYNNLGVSLAAIERWEESYAALRQALTLKPDNAEALDNFRKLEDFLQGKETGPLP